MTKVESALQRTTDTKDLIIGAGVVARTAEMFAKLFPQQTAIIVADKNTWEVAGKAVFASLEEAGVPQEKPFIFTDEELYAEWQAKLYISLDNFSILSVYLISKLFNSALSILTPVISISYKMSISGISMS